MTRVYGVKCVLLSLRVLLGNRRRRQEETASARDQDFTLWRLDGLSKKKDLSRSLLVGWTSELFAQSGWLFPDCMLS